MQEQELSWEHVVPVVPRRAFNTLLAQVRGRTEPFYERTRVGGGADCFWIFLAANRHHLDQDCCEVRIELIANDHPATRCMIKLAIDENHTRVVHFEGKVSKKNFKVVTGYLRNRMPSNGEVLNLHPSLQDNVLRALDVVALTEVLEIVHNLPGISISTSGMPTMLTVRCPDSKISMGVWPGVYGRHEPSLHIEFVYDFQYTLLSNNDAVDYRVVATVKRGSVEVVSVTGGLPAKFIEQLEELMPLLVQGTKALGLRQQF